MILISLLGAYISTRGGVNAILEPFRSLESVSVAL